MSKKNLTIIDADSLAYFCGHHETLAKSIETVDARIDNIISNTNADYISLFISKGKYFRHDIFPDYKGNRTQPPPKWMRSIKSYLEDKYKANWMPKVEADDLVAYWMNQKFYYGKFTNPHSDSHWSICDCEMVKLADEFKDFNVTMAAIDKDLLKSIPGKHYNYTFKPNDKAKIKKKADKECKVLESEIIKGWWKETDQVYANNFIWLQMLMGELSPKLL